MEEEECFWEGKRGIEREETGGAKRQGEHGKSVWIMVVLLSSLFFFMGREACVYT